MRRECRKRFPPPPISKETDSWRSRHASRHVRDARAVMHVGIAHLRWRGKRSRHSRRMRTRNFTYLARGPFIAALLPNGPFGITAGNIWKFSGRKRNRECPSLLHCSGWDIHMEHTFIENGTIWNESAKCWLLCSGPNILEKRYLYYNVW